MHTNNIGLLKIYLERFANRSDVYTTQRVYIDRKTGKEKCIYPPVHHHLTTGTVYAHVKGIITIGWVPFDSKGYSKWICFDSDTSDGQLDKLQAFLEDYGWHCIREGKRPGRDGHLWILFDKPVLASQLRILARAMLRFAGVTIKEVFPKQDIAAIGNVVRGPLGIHRKSGANNCRGLFDACPEKTVRAQLEWLAQQPLNSTETAMKLAHEHRTMPKPVYLKPLKPSAGFIDFVDYAYDSGFSVDGDYMRGPCPLCIEEGHDTDRNHMWVNVKTGAVGCWRCGKEKFSEIVKLIRDAISGAA